MSGSISLLIGAAKGSIALSKSKKVREVIDKLKGIKVCSKTANKIDDFEKGLKDIVKPNEGGSTNNGAGKTANVVTEADRIKHFNLQNCREQMRSDLKNIEKSY
ncbi:MULTISPECIES: hypothetical protein [unclassified Clostridium]|uniref:hypothetical protein n=1 Tax=unclassified Clostridium TaxID=2614128 RepID=UPI002079C570|nr:MULTISPECIES: hypothetical protein [unclassified Clostridium]